MDRAEGGGEAHRLTRTKEAEEFPKFSPDGKWIAFTRDGSVFVMPSCGGEERRLTWRPGWNQVLGWTPDGRNVLVHSDRLKGSVTSNPHLFLVREQGGWPNPLPMPRATHGSFSADRQKIAYGPNPEIVLWTPFRHYRGGALGYIAIFCPSAEKLPCVARGIGKGFGHPPCSGTRNRWGLLVTDPFKRSE